MDFPILDDLYLPKGDYLTSILPSKIGWFSCFQNITLRWSLPNWDELPKANYIASIYYGLVTQKWKTLAVTLGVILEAMHRWK